VQESTLFDIAAVIVTLAAVFGYINHRFLKLPQSIGLVIIALSASMSVIALDAVFPSLGFRATAREALGQIDFHEALMKGMLSFLLFAGALHVDMGRLFDRKWAIGSMATVGVIMSTLLVGFAMYFIVGMFGLPIPLPYCLVFGALISPTDPVAVLGILKTIDVPESLEAKIAGESLFNDGIGVVVFTILATIAVSDTMISPLGIAELFATEALGGGLLGLAGGYVAYRAMKSIDEHNLEVLITLALVMMTYSVAFTLHLSGPIAVVVAGLLIGNRGTRHAMSENTRDHIVKFWSLTDEILNSILFLIIGFEIVALTFSTPIVWATVVAVPVVVLSRFIAVATPLTFLGLGHTFTKGAIPILTWGGLRGGISVALALSLPESPIRDAILTLTFGVVIFSIVVQGLTVKKLVQILIH